MNKITYIKMEDLPSKHQKEFGCVYLCETPHGYKIGMSKDLRGRMVMLNDEFKGRVNTIHYHVFGIDTYSEAENCFHSIFAEKNNGFRFEFFDLDEKDVEYFMSNKICNEVLSMIDNTKLNKRNRKIKDVTKPIKKRLSKIAKLEKEIEAERWKLKKETSDMFRYRGWLDEYNITESDLEKEISEFKKTL